MRPFHFSKAQSAMEYLMTYGWAILIIAVVLGALFQLGVFNSSSFSPRAPPGACQVFRPGGPNTVTNINLMGVCTGQLPQYVAQFNGQNSYVNAGNGAGLNPTSAITISAWIFPVGWGSYPVNGYARIIDKQIGAFYVYLNKVDGSVTITIAGDVRPSASYVIVLNQWQHVAITYDKQNVKIYVNGASKGTYADTDAIGTDTNNAIIGNSEQYSLARPFNGSISNVQIYNASFSANEIQALYLEGIGGAPILLQNLVGWWSLNGDAKDYSGNNNNGVPTAVTFTSQYGK